MNTSSAHLSPIETCPFGFPSRLLLMGAVVITACRPSGISGLILVPNSPGPGLSHVSALVSSHGENSTWRNTFKPLKYAWAYPETDKSAQFVLDEWVTWVPWISPQHNSSYTVYSSLVFTCNRRVRRCVTGLTVTAERSNRDDQECNSIVTSISGLFFPPSLSVSVYLSAALMRFHENSKTEQVGVVAPGTETSMGTTKLNREEAVLEDFCYLCLSSPSLHGSSL